MRVKNFISILFCLVFAATFAQAQNIDWVRQFGSSDFDFAQAIFVDSTGVYVVGSVYGSFPSQTSAGGADAFIRKYDFEGNEVWTRQFGSPDSDSALAIFADSSGIYVVGAARGAFPGQIPSGGYDAFITKFDVNGNEIWSRQFGSSDYDYAKAVSADTSGIYVVGYTYDSLPGQISVGGSDAFIKKYDADGNDIWTKQFGTPDTDFFNDIYIDSSGIYAVGVTYGTLTGQISAGDSDAFIQKYDSEGNEVWTRQFGTPNTDIAKALTADSSGIYVVGNTHGIFPNQTSAGGSDAYIRKYDADGNEAWTRQFGTSSSDFAYDVCSGIHVVGATHGALPGQISVGSSDIFIRQYNTHGNEGWTRQYGNSSWDSANGISFHFTGTYLVGQTSGAFLGQTSAGGPDAFILKIGRGPNRPPTIRSVSDQTWYVGFENSLKLSLEDPDGDPLTISATDLPPGVNINPSGLVSGTPTAVGNFSIRVTAKDGQEGSAFTHFKIIVKITVEGLIWRVKKLGLPGEITRSLLSPLELAREARSRKNIEAFKNSLETFINKVKEAQNNKHIDPEAAENLIELTRVRLKENI